MPRGEYVVPFSQLRMTDVEAVGGKNASLGEMLSQLSSAGIRVLLAELFDRGREDLRWQMLPKRFQ